MAHGRRLLGLWRWDTSLVHSTPTREEALTHAFTQVSGLGCTRARTHLARKHDSVRYSGLAPLRRGFRGLRHDIRVTLPTLCRLPTAVATLHLCYRASPPPACAGREASGCEYCLLSSHPPPRSGRNLPLLVGCTMVSFYVFLALLGTYPVLSTAPV